MTKDRVGKDYLTSSDIDHICCFCWFGDICNQWWQCCNLQMNCSIGEKQKQLPHQRDPSVATDYYIQSTEKRTHVRSGRRKETVKSMSPSSSQPRDLAWYPCLMHLLQHEFLIVYLPHGAFWHSFLEPAHCQWELPTSLKELHGKSYISEVVE